MIKYTIQRLGLAIITIFGTAVLVFVIMRVIPGDPASLALGLEASPEAIAAERVKLGLNLPIPIQLFHYLKDILSGNWGESIQTSRPVIIDVKVAFSHTLTLVSITIILATIIGVSIGLITARWRNTYLDKGVIVFSIFGICIPSYFWAIILILIFAVKTHWLPAIGIGGFKHIILPVITLTLSTVTIIARVTRATIIEILHSDFMRMAKAKGLSETKAIIFHGLPNSLIPIITVVGLQTSYMLGGAALVETIFAYPGIGWLLIQSITVRDYPLVQACIIVIAFATVLTNLLVDISYPFLDPRAQSFEIERE